MTVVITKRKENTSNNAMDEKKTGWRSRGWTPLKYPKSAILRTDDGSFAYFPLHQDVLFATVRELLVLDGTLDSATLKTSNNASTLVVDGEYVLVPSYKRHSEPDSWPLGAPEVNEDHNAKNPRKRKKNQTERNKRIKREHEVVLSEPEVDTAKHEGGTPSQSFHEDEDSPRLSSAEDIATAVVLRSRIVVSSDEAENNETEQSPEISQRPPHKISEEDLSPSIGPLSPRREPEVLDDEKDFGEFGSQEISCAIDLNMRNSNGRFAVRACAEDIANMLHASISNEALLRDAAMTMTQNLIATFPDRPLRLFFGYKTPAVSRERLTQLLAGFLFDTSHAMFAWSQTEQEVVARAPETTNLDAVVRTALFDDRALKKIGGFGPSSLLLHAISIGRLRRRKSSWIFFATTAQGKRMLEHHSRDKSIISVGKERRGQRLRQRYWLTSSLLWQENDSEASISTAPRSRACSLSSEGEDENMLHQNVDLTRQTRILSDMPGSKAISLVKQPPNTCWGVCLAKEGSACVVGRAEEHPAGTSEDKYLRCGDMILYAQNEGGQEACSPLCAWSNSDFTGGDWYRILVDLFKTSQELHLVVQRIN
jgi:hypothetical protein